MRDALPPLSCLRAFEVAARYCSFTQAGSELNLSQSAISRQIKRLEHDLGRLLFERHHEGLRLTPTGELSRNDYCAIWAMKLHASGGVEMTGN